MLNRRSLIIGGLAACATEPFQPTETAMAILFYSPHYSLRFFGLEGLHPFDIHKLARIAQGVQDLAVLHDVPLVDEEQLSKVHTSDYLASLHLAKPLSAALEVSVPSLFSRFIPSKILAPFQYAVSGTCSAVAASTSTPLAINIGGGFHHAHRSFGHGFCLYNDVALAIHKHRKAGFTGKITIIDTDAHQGDGNHSFFADDPTVFSASLHQNSAFPFPKVQGDLDVGLPNHVDREEYFAALSGLIEQAIVGADLIIHVAGADILADDPLTDLNLSVQDLIDRDQLVAQVAKARSIPLVMVLAGGYGPSAGQAQLGSIRNLITMFG